MSPCAMRPEVDRHFAGTLHPAAERLLREHLPACEECRRTYERHLLLASLDPKALNPEERLARGLGLRPARAAPRRSQALGLLAAAAALTAVLGLPLLKRDGFATRGTGAAPAPVHLSVYRWEGGKAVPVESEIGEDDELAFAYENRAGRRRLLVVGVDEHRHYYWFFPAWKDPAQNPEAIPIAPAERPQELTEAISHGLDGERLTLRAIFTDEALTVREVERRLDQGEPLPADALEQTIPLSIRKEGQR